MSSDPADLVPWPLRTPRLRLRRCNADDAAGVYAYQRLEELGEWMMFRCAPWEDFAAQFAIPERMAHRVIVEQENEVVGDFKLAIGGAWAQDSVQEQAEGTEAEVGWAIAPSCQGQGFAGEAARALITAVFTHTQVRRIVAYAFADNVASTRLMESLGMRREGLFRRESLHRTRGWIDGVTYAVLKDEWTG